MRTGGLRLRWSWRDLRQRWVQVAAISLILALGTGVFAALGSTAVWRRASNDASFSITNLHDLKVRLSAGTTTAEGTLRQMAEALPSAALIRASEERLVWPTQYEVRTATGTVLVGGELVGAPQDALIDRTVLRGGAEPADAATGLLELGFARARHLPPSGSVTAGGDVRVTYSGTAMAPEYFYVVPPSGQLLAQGSHAAVFLALARAQEVAGRPGEVNDLVIDLTAAADRSEVKRELEAALERARLTGDVTTGEEEPAHRVLYEDIGNDQQIWNLVSVLILLGASFAAFNLISRIVDSQRREIGIGMALGVPPRQLAVRPLLVGFQVALLGVAGGVVVGMLVATAMRSLLDAALPLPIWRTPFQPGTFVLAVAIGLALPFLATAIPVWRAMRVEPVEAIRAGRGASARPGWARLGSKLRWPRRSLQQYPIRNLLRAPRRTLLTVLAVAAAITVLVGVFGMLDSFSRTVRQGDAELTRTAPNRISVQLQSFEPVDGPTMTAMRSTQAVGAVSPEVLVPAELRSAGHDPIAVSVEVIDLQGAPWSPAVRRGVPPGPASGILVSEKAARDLGVRPGDRVVLRHPTREGAGYRMIDTEISVAGTHHLPLRPLAYLDTSQAGLFGLEGLTNRAQVVPAAGHSPQDTQRALFVLPGVQPPPSRSERPGRRGTMRWPATRASCVSCSSPSWRSRS